LNCLQVLMAVSSLWIWSDNCLLRYSMAMKYSIR